jgi:glycine cleavage system H protein
MKNNPNDLKYTTTHEWIKLEEANTARVGISDEAQALLGDIVFVELPELTTTVKKGDGICVIESVKAAADVYAPLSAEIIEINPTLSDNPGLINSDPYGEGWLFRIKFSEPQELETLLTVEKYQQQLAAEAH